MAEPVPTYHVDLWTNPEPTYVCCLCIPTERYTLEGVTAHLREVHNCDAIPTPHMDSLLALRTEYDARMAAAAAAQLPTPGAPLPDPAAAPAPESEAAAPAPSPDAPAPGSPAAPDEPASAGETPAAASPAPSPEESSPHA